MNDAGMRGDALFCEAVLPSTLGMWLRSNVSWPLTPSWSGIASTPLALLDRLVDLVWVAQEVCTQTLLPVVVAGLSPADTARIVRDRN